MKTSIEADWEAESMDIDSSSVTTKSDEMHLKQHHLDRSVKKMPSLKTICMTSSEEVEERDDDEDIDPRREGKKMPVLNASKVSLNPCKHDAKQYYDSHWTAQRCGADGERGVDYFADMNDVSFKPAPGSFECDHSLSSVTQPLGKMGMTSLQILDEMDHQVNPSFLRKLESMPIFSADMQDHVMLDADSLSAVRINESRNETVQLSSSSFEESATVGYEQNPRIIQTNLGPALLLSAPELAQNKTRMQARPTPSAASSTKKRKFQRWSEDEDAILRFAVDAEDDMRPNWKKISKSFFSSTRSPVQCKSRWTKSLQPGLQLGNWSEDEDDLIRTLRSQGMKWSEIADRLPGRIGEHVRDRYVNILSPDLKKTPWTKDEDRILREQQQLLGNKWTAIANFLPGRSENAVKNRWHNAKMTQRRRMRHQQESSSPDANGEDEESVDIMSSPSASV